MGSEGDPSSWVMPLKEEPMGWEGGSQCRRGQITGWHRQRRREWDTGSTRDRGDLELADEGELELGGISTDNILGEQILSTSSTLWN